MFRDLLCRSVGTWSNQVTIPPIPTIPDDRIPPKQFENISRPNRLQWNALTCSETNRMVLVDGGREERNREMSNLPFAYSPFQHKWRAILWAASDFPRHGRPTKITTNGARSGHGAMLFCINVVAPIFWPGIIQSRKKRYLWVNAFDSMEIFRCFSSSFFEQIEFWHRILFAWGLEHMFASCSSPRRWQTVSPANSEY